MRQENEQISQIKYQILKIQNILKLINDNILKEKYLQDLIKTYYKDSN
jgi:hypothetical protein